MSTVGNDTGVSHGDIMNNLYLNIDKKTKKLKSITFNHANYDKCTVSADELSDEVKKFYVSEFKKQKNSARYDRDFISKISIYDDDFDYHYTETNSPHLDDQIIRFETHKLFETALKQLMPDQQMIINEIYFNKTPAVELAKQLNISKSAVSHRLGRAKIALKKQIKLLDPTYNYEPVA